MTTISDQPGHCRHERRSATRRCQCGDYTACCDVDLAEHTEALADVEDGKQHG